MTAIVVLNSGCAEHYRPAECTCSNMYNSPNLGSGPSSRENVNKVYNPLIKRRVPNQFTTQLISLLTEEMPHNGYFYVPVKFPRPLFQNSRA